MVIGSTFRMIDNDELCAVLKLLYLSVFAAIELK